MFGDDQRENVGPFGRVPELYNSTTYIFFGNMGVGMIRSKTSTKRNPYKWRPYNG